MAKTLTVKSNVGQFLDELRDRLLNCLLALAAVFVVCYYYSNGIYSLISAPILSHVAPGTQVITTSVTAPFMVPMQLSFLCALLICLPYLLYQTWMFIRPALYKNERKTIVPIIFASTTLFYLGMSFAVFVICPVALKFFTNSAPNGVTVMLDIGNYLDFIFTVAVACGVAFQIPIVTSLLIRTGIMSKQALSSKRKHVVVLTLIAGMLLAPPDVISQLLLAVPMWGLFELGLVFSR